MVKLSLTNSQVALFQGRAPSGENREAHMPWQVWSAQSSDREESSVQAGDLAQKLCCRESPPTCYFQTNSAGSTQYEFVLQKEVCTNLIKSLNLVHILTYEGIRSHHFPQWNCKLLVTRILAITTTKSWTLPLWLLLLHGTDHFFSKQPPTPSPLKTFILSSNQGMGKASQKLSITSTFYIQILPLEICC